MLNPKIFNLMKCRAAKKFKNKFSNIHFIWKICTPTFSFEENISFPELSTLVEGSLVNGKLLQSNWNTGLETLKKLELIAFPI
jgi:hypothetical protein